jgi:protein-disulfide isomerase
MTLPEQSRATSNRPLQDSPFDECGSFETKKARATVSARESMKNRVFKHSSVGWLVVLAQLTAFLPAVLLAQNAPPITIDAQRAILSHPGTPVLGSARAEITVVEYFDYNCPFCRKLAPTFRAFTEADRTAAVIYKEWPIFGGVSVYAARSALAANYQGKYLQAHDALISATRLAENDQVDEVLRSVGIDMPQLKKDARNHGASIDALLERNDTEARSLGLRGTPGVLVDRTLVSGISNLTDLRTAVSEVRRRP